MTKSNRLCIVSRISTTVIATIVAMVLLDWRLAAVSLVAVPPFVYLTRRVGQVRRRITTERQSRLADLSESANRAHKPGSTTRLCRLLVDDGLGWSRPRSGL